MHSFFAWLDRTRYITRWSLMRSNVPESVADHSFRVAYLCHALLAVGRDVLGRDVPEPERGATAALFHDATEVMTGDLPTPVKYMNPDIRKSYAAVEKNGRNRLLASLPDALRPRYRALLTPDGEVLERYVKAADRLSAYIKCVEERQSGNGEFILAERQNLALLKGMELPEVEWFLENLMPAYSATIDEM